MTWPYKAALLAVIILLGVYVFKQNHINDQQHKFNVQVLRSLQAMERQR